MSGVLLLGMLLLLLALGLPVTFVLGLVSIVGLYWFMGGVSALDQVAVGSFNNLESFVLVAVPMFILMAEVLLAGGVGQDLFKMGDRWLRHLPGGLAVATMVACALFSAVSGSSVATAITIGAIAIPEMVRRGYPKRPVLGAVATGGTLGVLIPPSIPMILYASTTQESVVSLFSAGILPGIVLTFLLCAYAFLAIGRQVPREPPATWRERGIATRNAFWGLLTPLIVLGGIYSGIFTPTESAAIGVIYSLFITMVVYRSLSWRQLPGVLLSTANRTTMVMMIIVGALLFGHVLTALRIPQEITAYVAAQDVSRWLILACVILLLLGLGMFLEVISILLITLPILFPLIVALDFSPIWFAVVFVIVMEVALLTPPIGLNLFVVQGVSGGESLAGVIRGVVPFLCIMALMLAIVIALPSLTTYLPSLGN